jgi:Kelch motif/Galactose oxidase, central domain
VQRLAPATGCLLVAASLELVVAGGPARPTAHAPQPERRGTLRVVPAGKMAVARAAHQATLLRDGRVLITGGCTGEHCGSVLASVEMFDTRTHSFRSAAPMAVPRASHAAALLPDGRVLVAGGWDGRRAVASAEIYDPLADHWSPAGRMTAARASPIAVALAGGDVLVFGGGDGRLGRLASAEVFHPATARFSMVGHARTNHYLATRLADGRVLLTGGQDAQGDVLRGAEIFDPTTGTFTPTGDMAVARVKHAAALLPDGDVLIVGGSDARGYRSRFASTEIYHPDAGEFVRGPDMRWARHKIRDAVALLPSGDVLVGGGAPRAERFDPTRRLFVPVEGQVSGPQMFATLTSLGNGAALLLGGYDDRTQPSAQAWLIAPAR